MNPARPRRGAALGRWAVRVLLVLALPAQAETLSFRGYAYELGSNRFLYTELHEQRIEDGRWRSGTIDYVGPDGAHLGRKTLDFSRHPYVPLYRLELPADGYLEAITAVDDAQIEMVQRSAADAPLRRVSVPLPEVVAADSGFHAFLRDRFGELMAGHTVGFVFAVAGRLDTFRFRARKLGETTFEGRPAVALRVEPDSMLRFLVAPLTLTYDPVARRLLEYRGIANLHDPQTGKAYNARIIYPSRPPADAPALKAGPMKNETTRQPPSPALQPRGAGGGG